jgi:dinuclear metal center YbgI/SA1388 family protein
MTSGEIFDELQKIMPLELAMEWDNPGFLEGRRDKEVKKIMVTLDLTEMAADRAVEEEYDLIVSHHPKIWNKLSHVTWDNNIERIFMKLIRADISYIAMHTNYDVADGCMADVSAKLLKLAGTEPLEVTGVQNGHEVGIGKIGMLPEAMTAREIAVYVKKCLDLDHVLMYGEDVFEKTQRIAVSPGSGRGMYHFAMDKGVKVLVTGDITHSEAVDIVESGICVIDAGHHGTEKCFVDDMIGKLSSICSGEAVIEAENRTYDRKVV